MTEFGDDYLESVRMSAHPRIRKTMLGLSCMVEADGARIPFKVQRPFKGILLQIPDECCKHFSINAVIANRLQWIGPVPAALYRVSDYDRIIAIAAKEQWGDDELAAALSRFKLYWHTMNTGEHGELHVTGDVGYFSCVIKGVELRGDE